MKFYIILAMTIGLTWGVSPAQSDVIKNDFNLVAKVETKKREPIVSTSPDMNDLIYLKARIKELEQENAKLKGKRDFGDMYVSEDGKLMFKDPGSTKDWEWNGKTWVRDGVEIVQPSKIKPQIQYYLPQSSCPDGRCPLKQ